MAQPIPSIDDVKRVVGGLYPNGVNVTLASTKQLAPALKDGYAGVYAADDGTVRALWVCDLPLAASFATALTMVPAGMVAEVVRTGSLPDHLVENLREVFNVGLQLFTPRGARHVKLLSVTKPPPVDLKKIEARLDLALEIRGYSAGHAAFISVKHD